MRFNIRFRSMDQHSRAPAIGYAVDTLRKSGLHSVFKRQCEDSFHGLISTHGLSEQIHRSIHAEDHASPSLEHRRPDGMCSKVRQEKMDAFQWDTMMVDTPKCYLEDKTIARTLILQTMNLIDHNQPVGFGVVWKES